MEGCEIFRAFLEWGWSGSVRTRGRDASGALDGRGTAHQMCRIVYSPEEGFQRSVTGMDGSQMAEVAIDCACERDFRAWRSNEL